MRTLQSIHILLVASAIFGLAPGDLRANPADRWYKPKPGTLEFRDAIPFDALDPRSGIPPGRGKYRKPNGDTFYVAHKVILNSRHIQYVHLGPGEYEKNSRDITLYMNPAGMERIFAYTRSNRTRHLAFLINGALIAAPLNRRTITYAMSMNRFRGRVLGTLLDALTPTSAPDSRRLARGHIAWLKTKAKALPRERYLKRALAERYIRARECDTARIHLVPLLYTVRGSLEHFESLVIRLGQCYYLKQGMARARRWYDESLRALAHRIARDPSLELILRTGLAQLLAASGDTREAVREYRRIIRLARRSGSRYRAFINETRAEIRKLNK